MATQQNTVEYAWDHINTATNEDTVFTSGDITINIPENTSRTFLSCILDIVVHDNEASVADDISAINVGASCNGGTNWTDRNITTTLADSGEQMSFHIYADVTAEFTARFSGTSDTCRFRLQMDYSSTGNQFLNISAKVIITYQYDDTAQTTRLKTVRIPLESLTTRPASATPTEIGTNQIPNLDSFLPDEGTYRAIFAEVWLNTAPNGTTDSTITLDLNTTPSLTIGTIENGNQSPILIRITWDLLAAGMTTNAAHALRFTANSVAMGVAIGGFITVTYEYNHSTVTSVMNSVILPVGMESGQLLTSGDKTRLEFKFFVTEPATITLAQSAVVVFLGLSTNTPTFSLAVGGQSARTYTLSQQTGQAGGALVVQRIDSGGAQGAGITLARGWNTITVDFYASTTFLSGAGCYLLLNYTSGVAGGGAISHKKTIAKCIMDTQGAAASVNRTGTSQSVAIPETNYWIDGVMCDVDVQRDASYGFSLKAEKQSGESPGAGFAVLGHQISVQVAERYFQKCFFDATALFKRHPGEVDAYRMDIETSRDFSFLASANSLFGLVLWVTYSAITFSGSRAVTAYGGDGSGIVVDLFRTDTREWLYTFTTSAGGTYTPTVYDDVLDYMSIAREDDTHVGRSANWNY